MLPLLLGSLVIVLGFHLSEFSKLCPWTVIFSAVVSSGNNVFGVLAELGLPAIVWAG